MPPKTQAPGRPPAAVAKGHASPALNGHKGTLAASGGGGGPASPVMQPPCGEGVAGPAGGEKATVEMRMAAALEAAEKSKALDLSNMRLGRIPDAVWSHVIDDNEMQTPLIPILKGLKLSNNKLADFEGWERLANLTDLSLDSNKLQGELPDEILALTNLTRLNIQSNQLRHLPRLGDYSRKLVELKANDNALQSLPPNMGVLTDLKTLEVSFNQLVMLPEEIGDCRSLQVIRARGNELKTLPVGLTKLWTLEELLLDKNPLVRLPFAVASMPLRQITYDVELLQSPPLAVAAQGPEFTMHYLKLLRASETRGKLELDELRLDLVPTEVCEIVGLMDLSMSHNLIATLPRSLCALTRLERLSVAHNKLQELPEHLTGLKRLHTLDVSHNMITSVPRGYGHCSSLASLLLEGNHIFSPPPLILKMGTPAVLMYLQQLCDADTLGKINLQALQLPVLPQEIAELSLVTSVDVSDNLLTSIRPLQVLTVLTALNVSRNRLAQVDDDLQGFLSLRLLDLSHNRIAQLASAVRKMTALEALNLGHNPLRELPQGLWSLSGLAKLSVDGCDIRFPPQDVVAKGVKSLLNYQRMIERGRYNRRLDLSAIGFHEVTVPEDVWAPLLVLNLDRNYVTTLPAKLLECQSLTELRVAHNQLVRLPEALGELATMTLLDVRNNVLQALPASLILLHNCQKLRLSGNRLSQLPEPLSGLTALVHLEAEDNALTDVPASLCDVGGLQQLRLVRNRLVQLPLGLGRLTALTVLTLTSNALVRLPLNLRLLTTLVEFDATDNPDIDLPPVAVVEQGAAASRNFLAMVHATLRSNELDMSGFGLVKTPQFLAGMTGLTGLNLANNQLDELMTVVPLMGTLTALNALGNQIKYLPVGVGGRTSLLDLRVDQEVWDTCADELRVSGSRQVRDYLSRILEARQSTALRLGKMGLQELPREYAKEALWHTLTHVTKLALDDNFLREVEVIAVMTCLESLDLGGNQLQTLPDGLGALTALTQVSVRKNKLAAIPHCVQKWVQLTELTLAENAIVALPVPVFEALKALVSLDCRNNQITEIKAPIWMLPRLHALLLQGNQVVSPPMAFVHKGKRAVIGYFKSLDAASRSLKLNLSQSDLLSLSHEVMSIRGLRALTLDDNLLQTLPPQVQQLNALTSLSIRRNKLTSLPHAMSALSALEIVDVSDNMIEDLPIAAMQHMVRLAELNLEGNRLRSAPFELVQSSVLRSLRLARNDTLLSPPPHLVNDAAQMERVLSFLRLEARAISSSKVVLAAQEAAYYPSEVARIPVVTELILSKNRLAAVGDDVALLTSMQRLHLDDNLIPQLPEALGRCVNLTELRLAGNELTTLPGALCGLTQLARLDISRNQMQALPEVVRACVRLVSLAAAHNGLSELAGWIGELSSLRSLELGGNELTSLPFQLGLLTRLHDLGLEDNDVTFPPSAIQDAGLDSIRRYLRRLEGASSTRSVDLSQVQMASFSCHEYMASFSLERLSLQHCGLRSIKPDIVRLSALQQLDVSHNQLAALPAALGELSCLKHINADSNVLTSLVGDVGKCAGLCTLSVADNQLTGLPPRLGFCTDLRTLTVAGNPLSSPPEVYVRKRSLAWLLGYLRARHEAEASGTLQVASMALSELPADVVDMPGVVKLNLSCNELRDMPSSVVKMTWLRHLSLTNNKLMRMPECLCQLTWLEALQLDDNMITELPLAVNAMNNLRALSLAHNTLAALPVKLTGLSKLRRLSLDGNAIGDIPRAVLQLTTLRMLSMRACAVAVLPEGLTNLRALQELHVNDNALDLLPDLSVCSHLEILRLSNNHLQALPPSVVELVSLRELSLLGNLISRLPDDFTRLTQLELLHLDGANFDSIPPDVTAQGGKRILEFMRKMSLADTAAALDLSSMGLAHVPSAVFRLETLQHLQLHDNPQLSALPPLLCQLTNLRSLTLGGTRVRSLPVMLPELVHLSKLDMDVERMQFPPPETCALGLNAIFAYLRKILNGAIVGKLDLSNTGMKEIPADLSLHTSIVTLDLSNNRIARIPPELCLLTALSSLNLDQNPLRPHVQDVVSHGLAALMRYLRALHAGAQTGKVDLVGQGLAFYPDEMAADWHVTWLCLDDNLLRHIPRKIAHLTSLTFVSVARNQLEDLPDTMAALTRLGTLVLDHNALEALPAFIYGLTSLTALSAAHNRLASLSEAMAALRRLASLDVRGNPALRYMPLCVGALPALETCEFDTATVVSPDAQFQKSVADMMAYLRTLSASARSRSLDLSSRGLTSFPMDVLQLTGLTYLTIARNAITSLPPDLGHHLSNLRMLDLEANQVDALPESIGFARHLTCIMALGNPIAVVPNSLGLVHDHGMLLELDPDRVRRPPPEVFSRGVVQALTYLRLLQEAEGTRQLSLNRWRLSALPLEVTALPGLTELSVSYNRLTRLPAELAALSHLTRLRVADNSLVALPPELGLLDALTDLDVSGNALESGFPTDDLVARGLAPLQAFLRETVKGKQTGVLDIGHLALSALHLAESTVEGVRLLSLDRVTPVHLRDFGLSASDAQLAALQELSICDAQLDFLPPFVRVCTGVTALNLSNNRLRELPAEVCEWLSGLTALRLNQNQLRDIPNCVSLLTDLQVLACSRNQLESINDVIAECCTGLAELALASNRIKTLPLNLARCNATMRFLDVENNELKTLPVVAMKLTQLTTLKLAGNPMSELPLELGKLVYLTHITVPANDLGNVPRDVVQAGGSAIIRYVCGINDCATSGLLDLSKMNLHVLPPSVRELRTALTFLKLDDNPLARLPNWLGEMQQLVRVSLSNTPLQRLPATLGAIATLEDVAVDGNSTTLLSPPVEVVAAGKAAVLSYLRRAYSAVIHRQLDLGGFGLTQFPLLALSTPTTLTALALNDNQLQEVPEALASITGLVMLSLANNRIMALPPRTFLAMPQLKSLNVGGNPLVRLPITLGALSQLEYLDFDASTALVSPPRDITVKSVVAVVTYLQRAWAGRRSGCLELNGLSLSDLPLEVTEWAPYIPPPEGLATEEGAGEVLAVEKKAPTESKKDRDSTPRALADDAPTQVQGQGAGGALSSAAHDENDQEQDSGQGSPQEEEEGREAAYAVDDAEGRQEQKEERTEAMRAEHVLAGEDAAVDGDRYENEDDDDRDFEAEEDIPATATLRYMEDVGGVEDAEAEAVVEELVSSDEEDLGAAWDDDEAESAEGSALLEENEVPGLRPLRKLDLRDNTLADLREEVGRMQSLRAVHLCRNEIKALPDTLAVLRNLRVLVATDNQISRVPDDLGALAHSLQLLDLQFNRLVEFPQAIARLSLLQELNLSHNALLLVKLEDPSFAALPALRYLYLDHNKLLAISAGVSSLPAEAGVDGGGHALSLASLRVLSAVDNQVATWPDFTQAKRLHTMRLSKNCLTKIGDSIANLRLLRLLDISNNQLRDIPAALSGAVRLRELMLHGNPLDSAPICAKDADTTGIFTFLTALNLAIQSGKATFRGHNLGSIPMQLLEVTHLHEVDLAFNSLSGSIPRYISMLTNLQVLNLADNALTNVPIELSHCPKLHTLNLDRNRFKDVVPCICAISQLEVLTMAENDIVTLPPDMANMVSLVMVDLRANEHLSPVAAALLSQNISRLMVYLRTIQSGLIYENMNLSRRGLTDFPIDVHCGNGTLKTLCLAYNEMTSLPESIAELVRLTELDVSNNMLQLLPQSLGAMTHLTSLILNDNELLSLPASFVQLSGLTALALERNPLENFPFAFVEQWTGLTQLSIDTEQPVVMPEGAVHSTTELMPLEVISQGMSKCQEYRLRLQRSRADGALDLSVMQLSFMPASVLRMPLLTRLNLTGNALLTIPDGITVLVSMRDLGLNDNRLSTLPAPMAALTKLEMLSAMDNRLVSLAPDIGRLSSLVTLNLTNNPDLVCPPPEVCSQGVGDILSFLNKISSGKTTGSIELSGLNLQLLCLPWQDLQSKLQALVLSRNQLAAVPLEVDTCTNLTALWLDSNTLTGLPPSFGKLCALKSLALDLNQLAALPSCVCELTALERLTLDNNVLRFLHPRMSELQSLTLLSAANNRLTMLPASLATIGALRSLTLAGNPLAPLPPGLRDRRDIDIDVEML